MKCQFILRADFSHTALAEQERPGGTIITIYGFHVPLEQAHSFFGYHTGFWKATVSAVGEDA